MPAEEPPAPSAQDAEQGQTDPLSKLDTASSGEQLPGPSRVAPRQGYCSCCQIVYNSVEQHILSPRHREAVRGSRTQVISGSLMERFLLDVIQHHPHRYNDPRPTHVDLPSLNSPLVPREELSDVCLSDDDGFSLRTREGLPSSDTDSSCQLVYIKDEEVAPATTASQPEEGRGGKAGTERLTLPGPDQGTRQSPLVQTRTPSPERLHTHSLRPCSAHTPPLVHRKAHRKTNRRREKGSSSSSLAPPATHITLQQEHQPTSKPREQSPDPKHRTESSAWATWGAKPPWKREAQRDEAFSSDHSDPVGDVIEEVIQRYCYGRSPAQRHQGDNDSFHLSLPGSLGGGSGDSEDWDTPVQVALGQGRAEGRQDTPRDAAAPGQGGAGGQQEDRDLTCLMEVRVNLEDQGYTSQLDTALNPDTRAGGEAAGAGGETYREPTVEEILPALPHIPPSFMGKTWTQVLLEDDLKVEAMVREFRQGCFLSYFDRESLARYGRRSREQKEHGQTECQVWEANVLPLTEHDEEDPECTRRRKGRHRGRRRSFRMASRCQVVKVSHGTQTTPLVTPVVRQLALDLTGTTMDSQTPCQDPNIANLESEKTPEMKTRLCSLLLPPSYTRIMTPLQPKTSLVYVLSSPETTLTDPKPRLKPIARGNGRKRKRSCDGGDIGVKVKYKRVPLRYYDPATNRILKTPPKGLLASLSPPGLPHPPKPHVVRQLFRSLSPDINSERQGGGERRDGSGGSRRRGRSAGSATSGSLLEPGGSNGVKGQGSSEAGSSVTSPFSRSSMSNSSRFLLGTSAPEPTSNPEVACQQSRRGGRGQDREQRTSRSEPLSPEKGPSPPPRTRRPGMVRGWTGMGREKPVSRSSKRGRPPRHTPSPPAMDLSPSTPPKSGPSRRAVESRKLPRPKGPARASPQRASPTSLKAPRAAGPRSSRRLTPVTLPPRTLRSRVRR